MKKTLLTLLASATISFSAQALAFSAEPEAHFTSTELAVSAYGNSLEITDLPLANTRIQICNLAGQVVKQYRAWPESGKLQLQVEVQKKGIYLISIENDNGLKTVRKVFLS